MSCPGCKSLYFCSAQWIFLFLFTADCSEHFVKEERVLHHTFSIKWSCSTAFALWKSENKTLRNVSCGYNLKSLLCQTFYCYCFVEGAGGGLANYQIFKLLNIKTLQQFIKLFFKSVSTSPQCVLLTNSIVKIKRPSAFCGGRFFFCFSSSRNFLVTFSTHPLEIAQTKSFS